MFKGLSTTDLYDRCIDAGLCKAHREELRIHDDHNSQEIQRKGILYIRLEIFGPVLFSKPFLCEKLKLLFERAECFSKRENQENHDEFMDRVLFLDSIAVFLLCQFSKICCVGAFFKSGPGACRRDLNDIFIKLLTDTTIDENDVGSLTPLLSDNFKDVSDALLKVCYVAVLLYVRNVSVQIDIKQAIYQLEVKIKKDSVRIQNIYAIRSYKESLHWELIANGAYCRRSWGEAYRAYTAALDYRPYCPGLLANRSHCSAKMGRLKDAFMDAYIAVMIDPYDINAYGKMITSLCIQEEYMYCIDVADYCINKCFRNEDSSRLVTLKNIKIQAQTELLRRGPSLATEYIAKLEKRDLPELIDASDSDSECQDVRDLVEASNSDESDSDINWSNLDTNDCSNGSLDIVEDQVKMLQESLKEASQTLLDGYGVMAVRHFQDALEEIKSCPEIHKYEESDIICIKYAYAFACYKSGEYDNLEKAITILKEITEENKDIVFPAAYYCIGLAYLKMNRFKLALEYFKKVDDMLQKEVKCSVFVWPGLATVINETQLDHLKNVLPDLITECENPPLPNALCRFEGCSLRPTIYYTDPDFKGLYSIKCSEQCCLQYHVQCWRSIRIVANHTDKEFLGKKCYTPDCEGLIVYIQIINKEGDVGKEFSLGENRKVSKQKKTKLEKKLEIKVEKKRKCKGSTSRTESISEVPEDISNENPSESEIVHPPKEIKSNSKHDVKNMNGNAHRPTHNVSTLSVNAEPFIVLKKEKLVNETSNKVPTKIKEHKQIKNNPYSIDEFLQKSDTPVYRSPEISKTGENASLDLKSDLEFPIPSFNLMECIKKNMYSHFKEILGKYGPLRFDDPRLMKKVKNFPEEAQVLADSDGIGKFLQQNVEFAFVRETYVCLVDQLPEAYKKIDEASLPVQNMDANINNFETSDSKDEKNSEIFRLSFLNPDAQEYLPETSSSELSPENMTDTKSDEEILEHSSPELISTISEISQPLTIHPLESFDSLFQQALFKISTDSSQNCDYKVMELVNKFKEAVKFYSNELKEHRNCIDASVQTENVEVEKVSRGTMKNDDELQKFKEMAKQLFDQKEVLVEQYKLSLDSATESNKKATEEITNLSKELSDAEIKFEEQTKEFKCVESTMKEKIERLSEQLKKAEKDNLAQAKDVETLQADNERQEVNGKSKLKNDIKNMELEKKEVEKRAQQAECLLLELKKTEFTRRIEIKKTEAVNKIEEVQSGIALISAHINPLVVKNLEILIIEIRKYISTLEQILKEFTVNIDEQIKEVNKGVPLIYLEPLNVEELPELPSLSCELMSSLMYQIPWPLLLTNPPLNSVNFNPYQFPSISTTIPDTKPNPVQQNLPLPPSYCSSFEDASNQAGNQPISYGAKVPPGLNVTKTVPHEPAVSVTSVVKQKNMTQQKNAAWMSGSSASVNWNPAKRTSDLKFGSSSSSLELDYNVKKKDASFAASAHASPSRSNIASPISKKNSEKDIKKSFEKLISKLEEKFPNISPSDIVTHVREFRGQRKNGLSGLTLENIIESVSEIIEAKEKEKNAAAIQVPEPIARMKMVPNTVLVNKKLVPGEKMKAPPPPPESSVKKTAWSNNHETDNSKQWSGNILDECAICCEEMTSATAYKVDCKHSFHLRCIKKWLEKKSDCPICRVHVLLPEDYPALS